MITSEKAFSQENIFSLLVLLKTMVIKKQSEKWYSKYVEDNIPDLSGKSLAITGTTSGTVTIFLITFFKGFWCVVAAIRKNAKRVYLLNRDSERSENSFERLNAEKAEIKSETELIQVSCDLSSFDSVKKGSEELIKLNEEESGLNILINNAGIEHGVEITDDGFIRISQVNHLSHFLLTSLLIDELRKSNSARIVNHTSGFRYWSSFKPEHYEKFKSDTAHKFSSGSLYGSTKISVALFSFELNKRLADEENEIIAITADPGMSTTGMLQRGMTNTILQKIAPAQSEQDGSMPLITAAFGKKVERNDLFLPSGLLNLRGKPKKGMKNGKPTWLLYGENNIRDEKNSLKLWKLSEKAIGKEFLSS